MFQTPGFPRIALLNSDGTKNKTLWLPMPNKGLPKTKWEEKGQIKPLIDGSESNRRLGWIPQITLEWSVYIDQINGSLTEGVSQGAWGLIIGPGDGQMPSMADLMDLLSNPPGSLMVSPGPLAGGFTAESWTVEEFGLNPLGQPEGLKVTLRSGAIFSTMVLGAF